MARFSQGSGSSNNGGAALNYVQVVGTQQTISSAPNSIVDLNITTTGKPVQISVTGEGANASAGSWLRLNLFRDNVEIGNAIQMESSAASENVPFAINFIDDVDAGTYNYSARVTTINGGSWTFGEASGPVINAVELTGFKGDRGLRGFTGDDALWNFRGAYDLGASYAIGDVATYDGETWYRLDANGGNTGDTPTEGDFWTLIAQKGADGEGSGNADIADFTFTLNDGEGSESVMTIHNHDMRIETTRDDDEDADIELNSADDIWINANDQIEITAANDNISITAVNESVSITAGGYRGDGGDTWEFHSDGSLTFPDNTVQTTAYTGTDSANHGDFYFDQTTLRVDSSSDMILESNEGDGSVSSQIKIGNGDVPINIVAYETDESSYGTGDWSTAEWQSDGNGAGQIVLTGITSIEQYLNNFNYDFQRVLIDDTTFVSFGGASYGGGNATIYVSEGPAGGTTATVLALRFIQSIGSGMMIDYDDSEMNIIARDMGINITTTGGNDLNITSSDDLDLEASDDIRFSSDINGDQKYWSMDSSGQFNLPGDGYISNPLNSSGDGNGYDTIKIVPDSDREQYDQYLIIDPTQPNHIHVRAGGTQDESLAELVIGGENTYVKVSDTDDSVTILANNININSYASPSSLNINTYSGATIQSNRTSAYSDEDKVVAVLGDINAVVPAETAFTVNGGTLGTQPTFNGDPLFSGTYVKTGPLVHFQIQVDMDNITSFGTGQYYVDLPFPAKYGYQVREGCLHDISAEKQYAIGGHVFAGQSRLNLFYTDTNGQDQDFDHNSPVTLTTADNFHVSGTYITNE
jgi:hypothetical protein